MTERFSKRLVYLVIAAVILAGCGGRSGQTEPARAVMSNHKNWTIRVTPIFSYATNRWRARAEVWPPERRHETSPGILLRFSDTAWDQKAVVQAAFQAAREYIDASQSQHQ
jgi:hypothetical protein